MRAMLVSFASYQLWLDWKKIQNILEKDLPVIERGFIILNFKFNQEKKKSEGLVPSLLF